MGGNATERNDRQAKPGKAGLFENYRLSHAFGAARRFLDGLTQLDRVVHLSDSPPSALISIT